VGINKIKTDTDFGTILIQNGEYINSSVTNRPHLALKSEINFLDSFIKGYEGTEYLDNPEAWNAAINYTKGVIVRWNSKNYVSLIENNLNLTPPTNGDSNWKVFKTLNERYIRDFNDTLGITDIRPNDINTVLSLNTTLPVYRATVSGDLSVSGMVMLNTGNSISPETGQLAWNQDERTMDIGLNGVTLQVGQETLMYVRNSTASTIMNRTACMAIGTLGASGRIRIQPMDGSVKANAKYLVGIATEDIPAGADGYITVFGKVRGVDTSFWNEGDVLYISNTIVGALTNIRPSGMILPIGYVISSHSNGTIFTRITNADENPVVESLVQTAINTSKTQAEANALAYAIALG